LRNMIGLGVLVRGSSRLVKWSGGRLYGSGSGGVKLAWDTVEGNKTGVAVISFDHPEKLNALSVAVGDRFQEISRELALCDKDTLRCVVVRGDEEGKAFSAGGDLQFLHDRTQSAALFNRDEMLRFYQRFLSIRDVGVPVLSALTGHAVGAGACLAMACDLRVAISRRARMGFNFVKLGLHPGMAATHFLSRCVGPHTAAMLLYTGRLVTADEACRLGLVGSVAENAGETFAMTLERAREIAEASPTAIRSLVHTLRVRENEGLPQALANEANGQSVCYNTPEMLEGLRCARQPKETPSFSWKKKQT